jgi:hypothetical protein
MKRAILAFLAGLLTWVLVVSLLNRGLRVALDGYAAAEARLAFTLGMLAGRLAIAALTSLLAGAVVAAVAPRSARTAWALGALLVLGFIPVHVSLWTSFPLWYHFVFLATLAPLVALGARLAAAARAPAR